VKDVVFDRSKERKIFLERFNKEKIVLTRYLMYRNEKGEII
jgi:hypothetical protein